jgi:hypothetical protein
MRSLYCCTKHIAADNTEPTQPFMQSARYIFPILTKPGIFRRIFIRIPNIKFHEYPASRSLPDICRQTQTGGRTDMTKIVVLLLAISANAPKNDDRQKCFIILARTVRSNCGLRISSVIISK